MSNLQLDWTEDELLADDPFDEPLSPAACGATAASTPTARTGRRGPDSAVPAIECVAGAPPRAVRHRALDVPLSTWPETYPNVAQAKFLVREGVRDPVITTLTRIGTVEGFGAMIRYANVDDLQRFFDESIAGTALAHLDRGLFEAHARDEAGFGGRGRPQADVVRGARRRVRAPRHRGRDRSSCSSAWASRGGRAPVPTPQRIRRQMARGARCSTTSTSSSR